LENNHKYDQVRICKEKIVEFLKVGPASD